MNFETTEKIDFYLPKVKAFVEDHVIPVEKKYTHKTDRWKKDGSHIRNWNLLKKRQKAGLMESILTR